MTAPRSDSTYVLHRDIEIAMRDGTRLTADLWLPNSRPAPTLLMRTPYGKNRVLQFFGYPIAPNLLSLLDAGYAVVVQECRGTYGSEGAFFPLRAERNDGSDTVAWLADQDWCDGNIGMFGGSYHGYVQWAAATGAVSGLRAIATSVSSPDYYRAPVYSAGGALSWHFALTWMAIVAIPELQSASVDDPTTAARLTEVASMRDNLMDHLTSLPPSRQPLLDDVVPWWSDFLLARPAGDDHWQELAVPAREVAVPGLHIGGWFDLLVEGTVAAYAQMRTDGATPEARDGQRLIIGPWTHTEYTGTYPDRQFGTAGAADGSGITDMHIRFYDRWVSRRRSAMDEPAVSIFVMGLDEWRHVRDWPVPGTEYVYYHLGSSGDANTAAGTGELTTGQSLSGGVDVFEYDPLDPVPTMGGRLLASGATRSAGPVDQRQVEERDDVLVYTTEVLTSAVCVIGHVRLILYASSSAADTDFTAKLVDVHPDGRAVYLTDGIVRARYRNSRDAPELLHPGEVTEFTVDVGVTANVFLPGHSIRLEVSSSNFPRYDRNSNTGGSIAWDGLGDMVIASNRIYHGPLTPSRLELPIVAQLVPAVRNTDSAGFVF